MVYLWFTIWKTIQDSPCPCPWGPRCWLRWTSPLGSRTPSPGRLPDGTGLVERHFNGGPWRKNMLWIIYLSNSMIIYIYIYTYVICLVFVYYVSVFMHWKHLHAHFSANFVGAMIEERFISAMAMVIRWGRARMVNTKRSCLVLGGREHHLLIFTSDQSQVCSGRRWHGGTRFAGNYWW